MRIKVAKNGVSSNNNNNNINNNGSTTTSTSTSSSTTTTTAGMGANLSPVVQSSSGLQSERQADRPSGSGGAALMRTQTHANANQNQSVQQHRNQNQPTQQQQQQQQQQINQTQTQNPYQNAKAGGGALVGQNSTSKLVTPTPALTPTTTAMTLTGANQQGEKKPLVVTKQTASLRRTNSPTLTSTSSTSSSTTSTHNDGYNSGDELEKPAQKRQLQRLEVDSEGNVWKEVKIGPKKKKLLLKKMGEDGNCLFRAIADQVFGDQEMHGTIRKLCMDYMQAERDHYSQFVTEEFEAYVNRKRKEKCFGNNVEIQAICELYNRPIEVYTDDPVPINIFHATYQTDNAPIRLWYNGVNHYNSLVDPYEATIGVGLGLPEFKPGLADKLQMDKAMKSSEDDDLDRKYLSDLQRESDLEVTERELEEAAIAASLAEYWQSFSK